MKSDWRQEVDEGRGFARTAVNAYAKGTFDNNFKFNLLTPAIEKYLVGFFNYKVSSCYPHGLTALMGDVFRKREVPEDLKVAVNNIGLFQNICGGNELKVPSDRELSSMIETLNQVANFVENELPQVACVLLF